MQTLRLSISGLQRPTIHEIAASILTICWTRRSRQTPNISHSPRPNKSRLLHFSRTDAVYSPSHPPKSRNRGPASTESTQTDFSKFDVLGGAPVPSTSVDACLRDGFKLNNGLTIVGGAGVLLVGGEAFPWRPWDAREKGGSNLLNSKGQWEVANEAWGILELVWPKPDLLIVGLGPSMVPLGVLTRKFINGLGMRVDVLDTRNASALFNLLATERGVGSVAAALIPLGWREGIGARQLNIECAQSKGLP